MPVCCRGFRIPFTATRYHSLTILPDTVPAELEVIAAPAAWGHPARSAGGRSDGMDEAASRQHVELPIHGVQFHPESILTEGGHRMLANWLGYCGAAPAESLVRQLEDEVASAIQVGGAPLRRETQRDPGAVVDRAARRRALGDYRIGALAAVLRVGALVEGARPSQRP